MKKFVYIGAFALLGFLMQFLMHAGGEIVYIKLLLSDYGTFGFGLPFSTWFLIHNVYSVFLLVAGMALGLWQGFYWWPRIYGPRLRDPG